MTSLSHYLSDLISQTIQELGVTPLSAISLEHPTNSEFGDFSCNVAMTLFSNLKASENGSASSQPADMSAALKNPRSLAEFIVSKIKTSSLWDETKISQVTVAGPGFINFTISPNYLTRAMVATLNEPQLITASGKGKQVVVEYSSPNIAKPFTVGHLRSTIIGNSVANILAVTGWKVRRDNHLGDWGTQFGKQIYAIKHLGLGNETANIAKISASNNPVKDLVELYVEFHALAETKPEMEDEARAWFQKLEAGDQEARQLWQQCISWSLIEFKRIYQRLGITFTENPDNDYLGYGESFFEDKMGVVVEELKQKKLLQEGKQGAQMVFFPNDQYPPIMILKKDGATLYATRDLATDKWRLTEYGSDVVVINEVGAEQSLYFQQLYALEQLLGWYKSGQRIHVKHGFYRFKDQKMSTRKGNVIWLEDVLNEAEKRARDLAQSKQETATELRPDSLPKHNQVDNSAKIGLGALKWNDLKRSSHLDVVFDWDEVVNLKGNSGPYMQYTYVRCQSIIHKAGLKNDHKKSIAESFDTQKYSPEKIEIEVMRGLSQFDEVVQLAAKDLAPHYICTYLYQLAQSFNGFYTELSVLGDEVSPAAKEYRLLLTQAVARVLAMGLGLLGIETVEQM